MIRMKGHVVVLFEPASYAHRIESQGTQVLILPAAPSAHFQLHQQGPKPGRGRSRRFQRMAALTRPVPGKQRFAGVREELDVLTCRFPGRADAPTEDPGRAHTYEEDAVVRGVALKQCIVHLIGRGKFDSDHAENLAPGRLTLYRRMNREFSDDMKGPPGQADPYAAPRYPDIVAGPAVAGGKGSKLRAPLARGRYF